MFKHPVVWLVIGWLVALFFPPTILTGLIHGVKPGG